MTMCHFRAQNGPFVLNKFFFVTNDYYYFHLPIGTFHCAKFKKILTGDPESWGCAIFGPKMVDLPQTNFFWKIVNIILIYLLAFFLWKIFKKFFQRIQSYEVAQFWGSNWPIFLNKNFFRKPVDEPCFFHSCLSTCQKWNSDINLLVKYWRLKNTEISFPESHFWL